MIKRKKSLTDQNITKVEEDEDDAEEYSWDVLMKKKIIIIHRERRRLPVPNMTKTTLFI